MITAQSFALDRDVSVSVRMTVVNVRAVRRAAVRKIMMRD